MNFLLANEQCRTVKK